jgi:hypothetical protein
MTVNTSGDVYFIYRGGTMPTGSSENVNSNSIVTTFNKTGSGGIVTFYFASGISVTGSAMTNSLNNFSNVTLTGLTALNGWHNGEGAGSSGGPTKTITNNTFNNIIGGTGSVTVMYVERSGGPSAVSNNTVSNITSAGTVTGINMVGSIASSTLLMTVSNNIIGPISSTGGSVTGIATSSPVTDLFKNKIYDLSSIGL